MRIYTHRDPAKVLPLWAGKKIHRVEDVVLTTFDPGFIDDVADAMERRNTVTLSVTEGQLYLDVNGVSLTSGIHRAEAPRPFFSAQGASASLRIGRERTLDSLS